MSRRKGSIRMQIRITSGKTTLLAELDETPTTRNLLAALPLASTASTWGAEVYFSVGAKSVLDPDATDVVDPGTVCYWVEGTSMAIPFGPTPASRGNECRLGTAVNVIGRLLDDPSALAAIRDGDSIRVEPVEEE